MLRASTTSAIRRTPPTPQNFSAEDGILVGRPGTVLDPDFRWRNIRGLQQVAHRDGERRLRAVALPPETSTGSLERYTYRAYWAPLKNFGYPEGDMAAHAALVATTAYRVQFFRKKY
jgi:hypothetical protein